MIAVVFTSSLNKMPENIARHVFRVCKKVLRDFLVHMHAVNPLYWDVVIQEDNLDFYPDDGILPGIGDRIVVNNVSNATEIFEEETAAFEPHPASMFNKVESVPGSDPLENVHIEHMGIYDSDGKTESHRFLKASALQELVPSDRPSHLVIPRLPEALSEYTNPSLFPKMFPSLFPLGTGGFDDATRRSPIGFCNQIEHFLDLHNPAFRRHQSFMFVALNIYQRHLSHLHTSLAIQKSCYAYVAPKIASLTPEILNRVAKYVEQENKVSDLPAEDRDAFMLVNEVSAISANIPGSSASKRKIRNDIHAYFGYFGMPHLFLTMNPNASHSPLFQVIYGDDLVDITQQFPDLASSVNRRIRVASDGVAGETFFSHSIEIFFEHLLGWDHETKQSKPGGGIFGKLRAYYGTVEFTDRGQLHGHFLIWLEGGLNPRETHVKMKENPDWQRQYFDFFEDLIHHHAPDVDMDIDIDPDFEPRAQGPPDPSDPLFDVEFPYEVKRCADVLQKHDVPCRKVCFKYGSEDCRFGFPHDIVPESSFDETDNSISLKCLDPMMNWFNPYILTFCRHNHDLRCILSGKSAKAAMIYITDYITKDDEQMHHTLSMFAAAVAKVADCMAPDPQDQTRAYLQSCLAAQIRYRKIHAQQCVRYCRGKSDGMCSHATVPLLSSALLSYMRQQYPQISNHTSLSKPSVTDNTNDSDSDDDDSFDNEQPVLLQQNSDSDDESPQGFEAVHKDGADAVEEDTFLHRITTDEEGNLYHSNQVDDYLYRDGALSHIHWYDFGRCFKKVKKCHRTSEFTTSSRFRLLAPHPDCDMHELLQIIDPQHKRPNPEHIPRIIGTKIPRKHQNDDVYAFFMLCHFIPFSAKSPLDLNGGFWECYKRAMTQNNSRVHPRFSAHAKEIMRNWDEIHECEDVRDADQLRKRQSKNKRMQRYSKDILSQLPAEFWDDPTSVTAAEKGPQAKLDHQTAFTLASFIGANWLTGSPTTAPTPPLINSPSTVSDIRDPFASLADFKKRWQAQINTAARERAHARRASLDPSKQLMPAQELKTQILSADTIQFASDRQITTEAALMIPTTHNLSPPRSWQEIMEGVEKKFGLNERQTWCFRICAYRFRELLAEKIRNGGSTDKEGTRPARSPSEPLRFLMTGPGGTGKTYTIAAFQYLMSQFDSAHLIHFLAPTGNTAVNLPNGQTIHKACGISVYKAVHESTCGSLGSGLA